MLFRSEAGLTAILSALIGEEIPPSDLAEIARLGLGATGAVARYWVDAARATARADGRALSIADLIREVTPRDDRSGDDVWTIALHEAGHAVVADALGQIVRRISCRPGPGSDGNTSIADLPAHPTADDIDRAITIAMGGQIGRAHV